MDDDCKDWYGAMVTKAMDEMCSEANACVKPAEFALLMFARQLTRNRTRQFKIASTVSSAPYLDAFNKQFPSKVPTSDWSDSATAGSETTVRPSSMSLATRTHPGREDAQAEQRTFDILVPSSGPSSRA